MILQDEVIAACQAVFTIMLLPTLLSKKARVPIATSFVTGVGLMVIATMFISLGLWISTLGSLANGIAWFAVGVWRQPPKKVDDKEES